MKKLKEETVLLVLWNMTKNPDFTASDMAEFAFKYGNEDAAGYAAQESGERFPQELGD